MPEKLRLKPLYHVPLLNCQFSADKLCSYFYRRAVMNEEKAGGPGFHPFAKLVARHQYRVAASFARADSEEKANAVGGSRTVEDSASLRAAGRALAAETYEKGGAFLRAGLAYGRAAKFLKEVPEAEQAKNASWEKELEEKADKCFESSSFCQAIAAFGRARQTWPPYVDSNQWD